MPAAPAAGTKVGVLTSYVRLPNGRHAGLGYIRQRGKGIQEGSVEGQEVEVGGVAATVVHIPAASFIIPPQQLPQKKVEPSQQLGPAGGRCCFPPSPLSTSVSSSPWLCRCGESRLLTISSKSCHSMRKASHPQTWVSPAMMHCSHRKLLVEHSMTSDGLC